MSDVQSLFSPVLNHLLVSNARSDKIPPSPLPSFRSRVIGGRWVRCADAMLRVERGAGETGLAWFSIEDRLKTGRLRSRARGVNYLEGGGPEHAGFWMVPKAFWLEVPLPDRLQWRQWMGEFRSSVRGYPVLIFGLEIAECDLDHEYGPPAPVPENCKAAPADKIGDNQRSGGSRGKVAEWHEFWFAAMKMLDQGELEGLPSQAALRAKLLAAIGDGLSEESIKPQVGRIWYSFVERSG